MEIETSPLATHKNSREIPQGIDTCEKFERLIGRTVCFSFFVWMEQLVPVIHDFTATTIERPSAEVVE